MPVCTTDDFGDKPRELFYGHMPAEAVVIDPVGAVVGILDDLWIL